MCLHASRPSITQKPGHGADERHALVCLEVVTHDNETCVGIGQEQPFDVSHNVCFASGVCNRWTDVFSCRQIKMAGQDVCPVPDFTCPALFCSAWHWRPIVLQRLNAWLLVHADDTRPFGFLSGCGCGMHLAQLLDLLGTYVPVFYVGMFPLPASTRCGGRLVQKQAAE